MQAAHKRATYSEKISFLFTLFFVSLLGRNSRLGGTGSDWGGKHGPEITPREAGPAKVYSEIIKF